MVELELLQRRERAVALLGEREAPPPLLARLRQGVVARLGLAEERQRHRDDAGDGEEGGEDERQRGHSAAGTWASP